MTVRTIPMSTNRTVLLLDRQTCGTVEQDWPHYRLTTRWLHRSNQNNTTIMSYVASLARCDLAVLSEAMPAPGTSPELDITTEAVVPAIETPYTQSLVPKRISNTSDPRKATPAVCTLRLVRNGLRYFPGDCTVFGSGCNMENCNAIDRSSGLFVVKAVPHHRAPLGDRFRTILI